MTMLLEIPTYYKVITFFFDNGKTTGRIEQTNTMECYKEEFGIYDMYVDTFTDAKEAQQFLNDTINA